MLLTINRFRAVRNVGGFICRYIFLYKCIWLCLYRAFKFEMIELIFEFLLVFRFDPLLIIFSPICTSYNLFSGYPKRHPFSANVCCINPRLVSVQPCTRHTSTHVPQKRKRSSYTFPFPLFIRGSKNLNSQSSPKLIQKYIFVPKKS